MWPSCWTQLLGEEEGESALPLPSHPCTPVRTRPTVAKPVRSHDERLGAWTLRALENKASRV